MFIYKITVLPINGIYIGLDTNEVYKEKRWKCHCRNAFGKDHNRKKTKIYRAMIEHGLDQCTYEVLETGFNSMAELALAEIKYIQMFDSFRNGLNSTIGGDGLFRWNLTTITPEEEASIRLALGRSFREMNHKKYEGTTPEQRSNMIACAFTPEVNKKRAKTLKKYYNAHPEAIDHKMKKLSEWRENNKEKLLEQCKANGLRGAAKMAKQIIAQLPNGEITTYVSKNEFRRQTGQWAYIVIAKTKEGIVHNGFKAWELQDYDGDIE